MTRIISLTDLSIFIQKKALSHLAKHWLLVPFFIMATFAAGQTSSSNTKQTPASSSLTGTQQGGHVPMRPSLLDSGKAATSELGSNVANAVVDASSDPPVPTAPIPAEEPKITSVVVFPQAASQTTSQGATKQDFVLEITGSGFADIRDMSNVHIAVLPAAGVTPTPIPVLSRSLDNSKILAQFTAPANYALEEVALSTGSSFVTFETGTLSCDFKSQVKLTPQIVPKKQAGDKYGNGVAKNFHSIQVSIVNECPMAIVVPLGGISVVTDHQAAQPPDDACTEEGSLVAFSLDHVTSIFSADRKLTGKRAIYFNTVQALATLGSAVEPFFAHGFTQGVAILGGGFTTASKELLVDMSAEQLQNLTSQSFGSTEQVASHGSLQKFVFVRRNEKCKGKPIETDLGTGQFSVNWELSPASAEAPKTLNAPAAKPAAAK